MTPDFSLTRFSLGGRRALVTGARRGLGRAIAAAMVASGATVAISHEGAHDADEACDTARAIGASAALPADLLDPAVPAALIEAAAGALGGPPHLLVCNAAFERRAALDDITADDADRHWAVNVRAALDLIRAARPGMRGLGGGRVLLLGSVQQWRPNPDQVAYAASKAALAHMGRNLARQLAPEGIAINILCPGAIETEGNAPVLADPAFRAARTAGIPMRRIGRPEDVAGAAVFLLSDAASYVTGTELLVDGGLAA